MTFVPMGYCFQSVRTGMPMHRGPHREYSDMVRERVGQIEHGWSHLRPRSPDAALEQALMRLSLLQAALRRRLLHDRKRLRLNRKDPLGKGRDFTKIDALAEDLWRQTGMLAD